MNNNVRDIQVSVPVLPDLVSDVTVLTWHKKLGDLVSKDEMLVELETDKLVLEIPAPESGILTKIVASEGDVAEAEEVIGLLTVGDFSVPVKDSGADDASNDLQKNRNATDETNQSDQEDITEVVARVLERRLGPAVLSYGAAAQPAEFLGPMADSLRFDRCFLVMP